MSSTSCSTSSSGCQGGLVGSVPVTFQTMEQAPFPELKTVSSELRLLRASHRPGYMWEPTIKQGMKIVLLLGDQYGFHALN